MSVIHNDFEDHFFLNSMHYKIRIRTLWKCLWKWEKIAKDTNKLFCILRRTGGHQLFVQGLFELMTALNEGAYDSCPNFWLLPSPHDCVNKIWALGNPPAFTRDAVVASPPIFLPYCPTGSLWASFLPPSLMSQLPFWCCRSPSGSSYSTMWPSYILKTIWLCPGSGHHFGAAPNSLQQLPKWSLLPRQTQMASRRKRG